eukprot:205402_1
MTIRPSPSSTTILLLVMVLVFDYVIAEQAPNCPATTSAEAAKDKEAGFAATLVHASDAEEKATMIGWICVKSKGTSCPASNPDTMKSDDWTAWKARKCDESAYYGAAPERKTWCFKPDAFACVDAPELFDVRAAVSDAKQSYIEELAGFYYDEAVEQARKGRAWFVLNENVNAETRRERDAYDRLQRENVKVQAKRGHVLSSKRIGRRAKEAHHYQ